MYAKERERGQGWRFVYVFSLSVTRLILSEVTESNSPSDKVVGEVEDHPTTNLQALILLMLFLTTDLAVSCQHRPGRVDRNHEEAIGGDRINRGCRIKRSRHLLGNVRRMGGTDS